METVDKYRKRTRGYAGFFFVIGAIQFLSAAIGSFSSDYLTNEEELGIYISALVYMTGAVMAWNGARAGALAIIVWMVTGLITELMMGTFGLVGLLRYGAFLVAAGMMCVAAFRHYKAARDTGAGRVKGWATLRWGGYVVLVPLMGLTVIGISYLVFPPAVSASIVHGANIPDEQIAWMREQGFLNEGETPLLFYSEGLQSIAEGGNLLTDQYIGAWSQTEDGELYSSWSRLGTVCEVVPVDDGAQTGMGVYEVQPAGEVDPFHVWLPSGDALQGTFLSRFDYLNSRHSNAEFEAACAEDRAVDWNEVSRLNGFPVGITEGDVLSQRTLNWLRGHDFLLTGETPLWLFTTARHELDEGGTLMTDSYFGGWGSEQGRMYSIWFEHGAICAFKHVSEESSETFNRYTVSGPGEERVFSFSLPVGASASDGRISRLKEITTSVQTEEQLAACESGVDPLVEQTEPESGAARET